MRSPRPGRTACRRVGLGSAPLSHAKAERKLCQFFSPRGCRNGSQTGSDYGVESQPRPISSSRRQCPQVPDVQAVTVARGAHQFRAIRRKGKVVCAILVGIFQPGVFPAGSGIEQAGDSRAGFHHQELAVRRKSGHLFPERFLEGNLRPGAYLPYADLTVMGEAPRRR